MINSSCRWKKLKYVRDRAVRLHCKKGWRFFPSPVGMSISKLSLAGKTCRKKKFWPERVWLVTSRLPFSYSVDIPKWYHRKGLGLLYVLTFICLIMKFSKRTFKFLSRAIYQIISNEKYALEDGVYGILSFYWLTQINMIKNLPKSSTNRILKPMREFAIWHTICTLTAVC